MRTSHLLLALPVLATAQQVPLFDQVKAWFGKATDSISSAIPAAPTISIPNPIASGAKKIASLKVQRLTVDNYKDVLRPGAATASPGFEEWMVFVTGGNKTCFGTCERAEQAFNESVALVSASRSPPNLAMLDCEANGVLCNAWTVNIPSLLHMFLPQPLADQSSATSVVRYIPVNRTTVTAPEIAAIHLQEKYKDVEPYQGFFHPFSGFLATSGLAIPFGYVLWGFSAVPSWVFMIGVSFLSRTFMGRRMQGQAGRAQQGQAPAAPAAPQ